MLTKNRTRIEHPRKYSPKKNPLRTGPGPAQSVDQSSNGVSLLPIGRTTEKVASKNAVAARIWELPVSRFHTRPGASPVRILELAKKFANLGIFAERTPGSQAGQPKQN